MENAIQIWRELGLPELNLEEPWFGYSLGQWSHELDQEAESAVRGEYYITGENQAKQRVYLSESES